MQISHVNIIQSLHSVISQFVGIYRTQKYNQSYLLAEKSVNSWEEQKFSRTE